MRGKTSRSWTMLAILCAAACTSSLAVSVTINPSERHQTVEGFGAFGQCSRYDQATYTNFLHDDLGVSMVRIQIPHDWEPSNDNSNPNNLNLSAFNVSGNFQRWKAIINGMKRFSDVRFIATVWTPPAWMKEFTRDTSPTCSDGTGACGGHLRADMRAELAEYLVAF